MALARCILGKFLGVGCHCFPPPLDVPIFSARCLHVQRREGPLAAEGGTLRRREIIRQIWPRMRLTLNSRDLLHAANLRHGTDGSTSPPKERVLRIFSPLKIRRLRPGANPRTSVPTASTPLLDHRSRFCKLLKKIRKLSFQPGLHNSNDLHAGLKMATFQLFFRSGRAKDLSSPLYYNYKEWSYQSWRGVFNVLLGVHRDISVQYEPPGCNIY
jgi:hypothetical protein